MAKLRVETSTGSVYFIDTDNRRWAKNQEHLKPLFLLAEGEWDGDRLNVPDIGSWPEVEVPTVGKNIYIRGRGMNDWWLSTPVVSVTEVEE